MMRAEVPEQLTFDLPSRPALGRDDFFVGPSNDAAVASLDQWRDWPANRMMLLGPQGSGKSHLALVWAADSGAKIIHASELAGSDLTVVAGASALAVEDIHLIFGSASSEQNLFHLHNLVEAAGGTILITCDRPPADTSIGLADLKSRLMAYPVARLNPPDDALLAAILVKLFADRQLRVTPGVVTYVLHRMDRSFAAAQTLVQALDQQALAQGKAVTKSIAGQVLDNLAAEQP